MKNFGGLVTRLYARLDGTQWVARLVVRIALGLEFFGSGLGKLGKRSGLIEYFRSLGIPAPEIQAPFVASTELVCGMLIAIGLATRPAALMLCGVLTVAIVTAAAPEKHLRRQVVEVERQEQKLLDLYLDESLREVRQSVGVCSWLDSGPRSRYSRARSDYDVNHPLTSLRNTIGRNRDGTLRRGLRGRRRQGLGVRRRG